MLRQSTNGPRRKRGMTHAWPMFIDRVAGAQTSPLNNPRYKCIWVSAINALITSRPSKRNAAHPATETTGKRVPNTLTSMPQRTRCTARRLHWTSRMQDNIALMMSQSLCVPWRPNNTTEPHVLGNTPDKQYIRRNCKTHRDEDSLSALLTSMPHYLRRGSSHTARLTLHASQINENLKAWS